MITTIYAGILGILFAGLIVYVAAGRYKYRVGLGDGGNQALLQRIRIHGNFAENVPLALFLIFLVDYSQYSPIIVHVLGCLLVFARVMHIWGISSSPLASPGRFLGTILTVIVLVAAGMLLIWKFLILRATAI